jgi:hypothetical protein
MYFLYVDESGDPGPFQNVQGGSTQYFILSALIVPVIQWRNYLSSLVDIRRYLKQQYGIGMRVELKGATMIHPRGDPIYIKLSRQRRIEMYREALNMFAARLPDIRVFHMHLDKQNPHHPNFLTGRDAEEIMWTWLLQRFDTFLKKNNNAYGVLFADQTNEVKLRRILRKMRVFNYVPSHFGGKYSSPVTQIIEDPVMRDSRHSYFIQFTDLCAHALYRKLYPKGSYRKFNVDLIFDELKPVCLPEAAQDDPLHLGIKHL